MTRRKFHQTMAAAAVAGQVRTSEGPVIAGYDTGSRTFTIGGGGFQQRLQLTGDGRLELAFFGLVQGRNWASPRSRWGTGFHTRTSPAALVRGSRGPVPVFGLSDPSRVRFVRHEIAPEGERTAELRLHFEEPGRKLEYVLHLRAFSGIAVMEQWLEVRNRGDQPLAGLDRFDPLLLPLSVDASTACTLHYVQGERAGFGRGGDSIQPYGPYHAGRIGLPAGNSYTLSSRQDNASRRRPTSTAEFLNWFSLDLGNQGDGIFGGIEWSGLWLFHFARTGSELIVQGGVDACRHELAPGETFSSPRILIGCHRAGLEAGIHEMHRYLRAFVMPSSPDAAFPWACYNTWYSWNIGLTEETQKQEAKLAADLGLECYYLDAGWYAGSPTKPASFGIGLGTWTENRKKFPSGISAFADHVHSLGMKFGLWVEPERVDGSLVDRPGSPIQKSWLADSGAPQPASRDSTHLLCFGNPEVVAWACETLSRVVAEYKVEWLKWDHNMYFVCTRADHGHQAGDGNYFHIQGVYRVMDHLRRKFPKLVIENCASGGYRTDLGIVRYTNTAWNSDATSPGHRVRYQTTGGSYVFPAQYQNSWFVKDRSEGVSETSSAAFLDYAFRSRMIGAFGVSDRLADWPANVRDAARRAVAAVKRMRPALAGDVYHLLPQSILFIPPLLPPNDWEAIEYFNPAVQRGVVLCFRADAEAAAAVLPVRGLERAARYRVAWNDAGRSETRTGADWDRIGAEIRLPEKFTSEILWIERA
jgi:alpha-galactosidase